MPSGDPPLRRRTPVSLLTGFLGSGKTTLLARLLRHPGMADTAVIINEFGEVGLDHLLVEKGEESVALLESGCLCCTVANSLGETLADLHFRRVRGDIPPFARVVIETTGLADPAPIIQTILTDYATARRYALDAVVATIDSGFGEAQLGRHAEAAKQAATAECLVVTKTDIADRTRIDSLKRLLGALNAGARIIEAANGDIEPSALFGSGGLDARRLSQEVERWFATPGAERHDHEHVGIKSSAYYLGGPITWCAYAAWLDALRRLDGARLLRVKGLVEMAGDPHPYVIQAVQHAFAEPRRLAMWPSDDRRSRIVLIVRDLAASVIEEAMKVLRSG